MAKHDRLTRTPVLVEDRDVILCRDGVHHCGAAFVTATSGAGVEFIGGAAPITLALTRVAGLIR